MKRGVWLLRLLLLLGLVPSSRSAEPAAPLSLEECLDLARKNSLKLRLADRNVEMKRAQRIESIGLVLPKISADGRFSVRNNDPGILRPDGPFVTGGRNLGTAHLGLIVPIYDFGGASSQIRASNLSIEQAEIEADQESQRLRLEVTQAYFRILEAIKIKTVVEESIQSVEQQLKISEDYYHQGIVAKNDLLVAEVQLARRQQENIQAQNNIELSTATLNRLIGLDVTAPTQVIDVQAAQTWSGSFEDLVSVALEKRADLREQAKSVGIAEATYRAARKSFFPKIYGFGDVNTTTDSRTLNQTWFSAGVGVSWTLVDVSTAMRTKEQRLRLEDAQDQEKDRTQDAILDIQRVYLQVREATDRIPVAQKTIDQATENLRITRDRYSEGLATSADVLLEEERLAQARSDYYQVLYNYHQAFAELTYAIGASPPTAKDGQEASR